jgi:hypothetical protein
MEPIENQQSCCPKQQNQQQNPLRTSEPLLAVTENQHSTETIYQEQTKHMQRETVKRAESVLLFLSFPYPSSQESSKGRDRENDKEGTTETERGGGV